VGLMGATPKLFQELQIKYTLRTTISVLNKVKNYQKCLKCLKTKKLFRVLEAFLLRELVTSTQKGIIVHKQQVCYIFIA